MAYYSEKFIRLIVAFYLIHIPNYSTSYSKRQQHFMGNIYMYRSNKDTAQIKTWTMDVTLDTVLPDNSVVPPSV